MGWTNDEDASLFFDTVIKDFQPDVIHVFGTEMSYGKILINKFDKVVFHLQGLVTPISKVYFPMGVSIKNILRFSQLKNILRGLTIYHFYLIVKQMGQREIEFVGQWKYFSGRTQWDQNFIKLLKQVNEKIRSKKKFI